MSIRSRLWLGYVLVLLTGMISAALLVWRAVENTYLETQRSNLLAQATLSAAALQGQALPSSSAQGYNQASNIAPGLHTRILSGQGAVLIGLPLQQADFYPPAASIPISAQELLQRPEIISALQGKAASAVRNVPVGASARVLYAAAPVNNDAGEISGLVYIATPLPAAGLPAELIWQLSAALLAALLLALLLSVYLARRLAQPVEHLSRAALQVSNGRLDMPLPQKTQVAEIDTLTAAFQQMIGDLRRSEQTRNAFIADVTHELRTPLTVIKGTIETLEDGALDDISGRGALLEGMHGESERLIRLVNDLLLLTRADAGMLNLNRQPLDLAQLARTRCRQLTPLAAQRGIHLQVNSPAETCLLSADGDRLAQVLDNLLDNAIRYSPDDGVIQVNLTHTGGEWHCTVSDQGPGITPEHLTNIFERFYRVEASRNRKSGGAGLGLAIARALVLAHGGCISAESTPGLGTHIRFSLPDA